MKDGADPSKWILLWDDPHAHRDSWRHILVPAFTSTTYSGQVRSVPFHEGITTMESWDAGHYAKSLIGKPYHGVHVLFADGTWRLVLQEELPSQLAKQGVAAD
ncbi:MAG: hypothetical protein JXN61_17375 [Sedimentisphaerales bacterium]|nr:hypothetical protein [Sedimentisphaerales bacterium]